MSALEKLDNTFNSCCGAYEGRGSKMPGTVPGVSKCSAGGGEDGDGGDDPWGQASGREHEQLPSPLAGTPGKRCRVDKEQVTSWVVHELGGAVLLVGDICPGPCVPDFWGGGAPRCVCWAGVAGSPRVAHTYSKGSLGSAFCSSGGIGILL